jgi:hypothetical protein
MMVNNTGRNESAMTLIAEGTIAVGALSGESPWELTSFTRGVVEVRLANERFGVYRSYSPVGVSWGCTCPSPFGLCIHKVLVGIQYSPRS